MKNIAFFEREVRNWLQASQNETKSHHGYGLPLSENTSVMCRSHYSIKSVYGCQCKDQQRCAGKYNHKIPLSLTDVVVKWPASNRYHCNGLRGSYKWKKNIRRCQGCNEVVRNRSKLRISVNCLKHGGITNY